MDDALVRVLLVDDEVRVLEGLERQLSFDFSIATATSGFDALRMLRDDGPFDVVISDMRMPRMTGAVLFSRIRELWPDVARILLTGYADAADAADAINRGTIFQYLNKPCDASTLAEVIVRGADDAAKKRAERSVLEDTVRGLAESILYSMVDPQSGAAKLAERTRTLANDLAREVDLRDVWQLQLAAILHTLSSLLKYAASPDTDPTAATLTTRLAGMPRMRGVARILASTPSGDAAPDDPVESLSAEILRCASNFANLELDKVEPDLALSLATAHVSERVASGLARIVGGTRIYEPSSSLVASLTPGVILDEDLFGEDGRVLVARGQRLTPSMCARLHEWAASEMVKPQVQILAATRSPAQEVA